MTYRIVLRDDAPSANHPAFNWWWVLKSAGNGAILATSETYTTKRKALATARPLAEALGIDVEVAR